MAKTMCIQRTIDRFVDSFMINWSSTLSAFRVALILHGADFQSIRAETRSRAAKNLPSVAQNSDP